MPEIRAGRLLIDDLSQVQGQLAPIAEQVQELLAEVSEEDRVLLLMKEVEGLSLKELQAIYKVNENAMKVRLFRARQRVLKAFERLGGDPS